MRTAPSEARPANASASEWDLLPWNWVMRAAVRIARRTGVESEDVANEVALHATEHVRELGPRIAINRAETTVTERVRRDHVCGMTGDNPALRSLRRAPLTAWTARTPETRGGYARRLRPSDWRALHAWLTRIVPERGGRKHMREILTALFRGETLGEIAERLGTTVERATKARTAALAHCYRALGTGVA